MFQGKGIFVFCVFIFSSSLYAQVVLEGAFEFPNKPQIVIRPEGNSQINEVKQKRTSYGSMVYFYLQNKSDVPLRIKDIQWNGLNLNEQKKNYRMIWWRIQDEPCNPSVETELTICLRDELAENTNFKIIFDNDFELNAPVKSGKPLFRIETITFNNKLDKAYLYIKSQKSKSILPKHVIINGKQVPASNLRWFNDDYIAGVCICSIKFDTPLKKGSFNVFRVTDAQGEFICGASIKAFTHLTVFGTYGLGTFKRYAQNGLTAFNTFGVLSKSKLDEAQCLGIRSVMTVKDNLNIETFGHDGIYAYCPVDEPDVRDWSSSAPIEYRIGSNAMDMLRYIKSYRRDSKTPTILTLDLTFTPYNYYIYGPIPDILNSDNYPMVAGWSIDVIKDYLSEVKRSVAPRPFVFTYQGCWEQYCKMQKVSKQQLLKEGCESFVDKKRTRGFGRKPTPEETRISMLYAIGKGAKGLFSFIDWTGVHDGVLYCGSDVLKEIWQVIGKTSRELDLISPVLELGHPINWAKSNNKKIWISTLICGEHEVLVVAINEDYKSCKEGFSINDARNIEYSFPELPWLGKLKVWKVLDGELKEIKSEVKCKEIIWNADLYDAQLYLISSRPGYVSQLLQEYKKKRQKITQKMSS